MSETFVIPNTQFYTWKNYRCAYEHYGVTVQISNYRLLARGLYDQHFFQNVISTELASKKTLGK